MKQNPIKSMWAVGLRKTLDKIMEYQAQTFGASATGYQKGGYHLYGHSGKSKTFKKNRRKELKASARRRHRRLMKS